MTSESVGEFRSRDDFVFAGWLHSHGLYFDFEPECPGCGDKLDHLFVLPEGRVIAQIRVSDSELHIKELVKSSKACGHKPFHAWIVEIINGRPHAREVYRFPEVKAGSWSIVRPLPRADGWTWCGYCGRPFILWPELDQGEEKTFRPTSKCFLSYCPHCLSDGVFFARDSDDLRLRRNKNVGYWRKHSIKERSGNREGEHNGDSQGQGL
jgi:hypothetical protein